MEDNPDSSSVSTQVATPIATDEVEIEQPEINVPMEQSVEVQPSIHEQEDEPQDEAEQDEQDEAEEEVINPLADIQEVSLVSNIETIEDQVELKEQLEVIREQLISSRQPSKPASNKTSKQPSSQPSKPTSKAPSIKSSKQPSQQPSQQHSNASSKVPSTVPSVHASKQPSTQVSTQPSKQPSKVPSKAPSKLPSAHVSKQPSTQVSTHPSKQPSKAPSVHSSKQPSTQVSTQPSKAPSIQVSARASRLPSFIESKAVSSINLQLPTLHPDDLDELDEIELNEVAIDVRDSVHSSLTGPSFEPVANGTTRNRKIDRRNLANDILAELPISIRFNENAFIDGNQDPLNYLQDWEQWNSNLDDDGYDLLEVLLMNLAEDELKYKRASNRNNVWNKGIQTALFVMGTAIVYIQASQTTAEVITRFNVASGIGTSIATMLLGLGNFAKKAPHFSKTSSNLMRLRCWIETS